MCLIMKKLLYIVLLLLPLITQGQSQSVTMQFRRMDPQVNSLDSIYYTFPGKVGGYSWFWNAAKIRDYVSPSNFIQNLGLGGTIQTGGFNISNLGVSQSGFIVGDPLSVSFFTPQAGLTPNSIFIVGMGYTGQFNSSRMTFQAGNSGTKAAQIQYDSLARQLQLVGDPVRSIARFKVDSIPVNPSDAVRLQDIGGAIPSGGFALKDSTLNPPKNLNDVPSKSTARLNLKAQRSTFVSALDFVTDTTGAADVTSQLQAAINATHGGGTLWIPTGKYLISSALTVNKKITIRGDNGNLTYNNPITSNVDTIGTVIISNSATTGAFTFNYPGWELDNIAILTKKGITATAGWGINSTNTGYMRMTNVQIGNFHKGINIQDGNYWNIFGCTFSQNVLYDIFISSTTGRTDIGDHNITNTNFSCAPTSTPVWFQNSGGLKITGCKFVTRGVTPTTNMIDAEITAGTSDIIISNSSFENFTGSAFKFRNTPTASFFQVQFHDNQITSGQANTAPYVDIKGARNIIINNNLMTNSPASSSTPAILLDSTQNVVVRENLITNGWLNKLSLTRHIAGITDTSTANYLISLINRAETISGIKTHTAVSNFQSGMGTGIIVGGADAGASTVTNNSRKVFRVASKNFNSSTATNVSMIDADNDGTNNSINIGFAAGGSNYGATTVNIGGVATTTTTGGASAFQVKPATTIVQTGAFGVGITPTALIHTKAGTATAGTAPLKFTTGVNLTTPESGAFEWDGARAYITSATGPTRNTIAYLTDVTGFANPMTTLGDVIYGGASGAPTRLAGNTATSRQFLTSTGNGTISAAPAYYNLFGTNATWTGVQTFTFGAVIGGGSPLNYNFGTFSTNFGALTSTANRTINLPDANGTVGLSHSGSFSGVGTATTTFTITTGVTEPNNTYRVQVTPTSALSAALFYVTNKTTTTFDVVYMAGLTGTVTFDWAVFNN